MCGKSKERDYNCHGERILRANLINSKRESLKNEFFEIYKWPSQFKIKGLLRI